MQKRVIIFGTGEGANIVKGCLLDNIIIVAYMDNNYKKIGNYYNNIIIRSVFELVDIEYDYIILSMMYHYESVAEQLREMNVLNDKVIVFFDKENIENCFKTEDIFVQNSFYKGLFYKEKKDKETAEILWERRYQNLKFEIAKNMGTVEIPNVLTIEQSINEIINKRLSVSRFGDGEFELMRGNPRPSFQKPNKKLAKQLESVLHKEEKGFRIAIADNYGNLEQYTQEAADSIRLYLDNKTREYHMKHLDHNKIYLNAYFSRPYIIYKKKENSKTRFEYIKRIWENREILIVEGDKTRMGIGNDLFKNARAIQRIIAPSENAYDSYESILEACKKFGKNQLFLIGLGPTATVLAYDLFQLGFQAIDIGHIDNEYEWYLNRTEKRIKIKDKYVGEVLGGNDVLSVREKPIEGIIKIIGAME